jgi:hypothetical protein
MALCSELFSAAKVAAASFRRSVLIMVLRAIFPLRILWKRAESPCSLDKVLSFLAE